MRHCHRTWANSRPANDEAHLNATTDGSGAARCCVNISRTGFGTIECDVQSQVLLLDCYFTVLCKSSFCANVWLGVAASLGGSYT